VSLYDIGGVIGAMVLGYLTDILHSRRIPVISGALILAVGVSVIFMCIEEDSYGLFCFIFLLLGILVGGSANLISGVCCTDLVSLFKCKLV
jgi:sugar phosphate permease